MTSWYPAFDDLAAGRFVLDQVAALAATGRVRPSVVSFEPIQLVGLPTQRSLQAAAVGRSLTAAIRDGQLDPFASKASSGPDGVETARLPFAAGATPTSGAAHASAARSVVLIALADRLIRTGRIPDVVHAHTGYPDGAAAAAFAARLDRPLVITEHSSTVERVLARPDTRERYEEAIGRASRVIAVSEVLAGELRASIPALGSDPRADTLVVIPNAVAMADFTAGAESDRDPDGLLFVGYRKRTKGIESLLRAFALVRSRRPAARLTLIGRSPTDEVEAEWRALAAELEIADGVSFREPADRAGVATALRRASVFVHPSPRETFGVVAVEALAAGLPVVAADSGGVTEVMGPRPERFGAVVPPDDPAALAAAIVDVLERRATFDPLALREVVESRFSAPIVAARLADLYEEVLAESGRAAGSLPRSSSAPPARPTAESAGPTVVATFARGDASRTLASLPASIGRSIRLVGSSPPDAGRSGAHVEPDLASRLEALLGARASVGLAPRGSRPMRTLRMARHPIQTLERLRRRRAMEQITDEARAAVEAGVAAAGGRPGQPVNLIALDGVALLAAEGVLSAGSARLLPGGLRHLVDRASSPPTLPRS